MNRSYKKLSEISKLENGWDGEHAIPIRFENIQSAKLILDRLTEYPTHLAPMTNGRLQLEWHKGKTSLELEIDSGTIYYLQVFNQDIMIEDSYPVNQFEKTRELVKWFYSSSES